MGAVHDHATYDFLQEGLAMVYAASAAQAEEIFDEVDLVI